jgi:hypothetical protein
MQLRHSSCRLLAAGCLLAVLAGAGFTSAGAQDKPKPIPEITNKNGRYALFVDGAPFLILGAQCHNSSTAGNATSIGRALVAKPRRKRISGGWRLRQDRFFFGHGSQTQFPARRGRQL